MQQKDREGMSSLPKNILSYHHLHITLYINLYVFPQRIYLFDKNAKSFS